MTKEEFLNTARRLKAQAEAKGYTVKSCLIGISGRRLKDAFSKEELGVEYVEIHGWHEDLVLLYSSRACNGGDRVASTTTTHPSPVMLEEFDPNTLKLPRVDNEEA